MTNNNTNYARTFEQTNDELTPADFVDMKGQLVPCSKELEAAMITDPDFVDMLKVSRNVKLPENAIRHNIRRLDRPFIVKVQKIPDDVLEEHLASFDWEDVQKYQVVPLSMIKTNWEIFTPRTAIKNVKYPQKTLEYLANVDSDLVDLIFEHQTVDESFIEPRINKANVNIISKHQKLSPEFIERHFEMFKPEILATCQQMSEELIEKHLKLFDLMVLVKHQTLSFEFCQRHKVNPSMIVMYQTPSMEYVQQSIQFNENSKTMLLNRITAPKRFNLQPLINPEIETYIIGLYTVDDISNRELDSAFIVRNVKVLDMMAVLKNNKLSLVDIRALYNDMNCICKCLVYLKQDNPDWKRRNDSGFKFWKDSTSFEAYKSLTPKQQEMFVKTFTAYVEKNMKWSGLLRENQVPEWFIDEFQKYIDWTYVIRTQKMSSGCIQRNLPHLDINYVVQYIPLDEEFILFNRDVIVWELVCKHQKITEKIIKECHAFIDIITLRQNSHISPTELDSLLKLYGSMGGNLTPTPMPAPSQSSSSSSGLFDLVKGLMHK
jgi:hypothetical protein